MRNADGRMTEGRNGKWDWRRPKKNTAVLRPRLLSINELIADKSRADCLGHLVPIYGPACYPGPSKFLDDVMGGFAAIRGI
jgi:hypothetical protein